ncbi:hypothetical protein JL475_32685 [Streptomyces sp. M2CJ-2]|uniref:hypothetical protein n=1 Tax=Streptomyces sp. M2CJ-2 TaxID=2803948 RepID=UPI001928A6C5|nr:hypothetical protein [Streptomyces sp. M2CJ-2]MBL3670644.1 hypothetical protein [Streptomyces sp. M2CJ-2]
MAERLTFTLAGRDELSRVLNGTADSADRLRLRMAGITADSDGQLRDLQGRFVSVDEAQRRLGDRTDIVRRRFTALSGEADKLGDAIKANLISLAPAAIPATAGLAGSAAALAGQFGAVAVAAGVYALALGPQIGKIGEARDAQEKYEQAVAASGRGSQEAAKAQQEYQRQLATMPPATREAAVAVGLLADGFEDWSDSLAGDVMGPFVKGVAVTNRLLPETTGLVKGASTQFDRLITLAGGAINTPGFDRLNNRFTDFTERTMRRGVDQLTVFLDKLSRGEYDGGGLAAFFDYAKENGPLVWDTLENVGEALITVLEAGSGVGVGMLDVINALSGIVSAVPPDAIALLLQLAIAIKAVKLAAAAGGAAPAAAAALAVQIGAMRAAAAGAPGPLAATSAAIATLGRTAKLAIAGTGIGLLVIALAELSQSGRSTAPDVDKLTTSLGELGRTGKATGYVAEQFGKDFGKLREQIQKVIDPSVADSIDNWGADITNGMLDASDSMEEFTASMESIDQGLADLVSGGKAEQAAAAVKAMTKGMNAEQVAKFTGELDKYKEALAAQAFEQKIAAQSMGVFGDQAIKVQQQLDAQAQSAEGLRQSIMALNDANRSAYDSEIQFEASIDALTEAFKENGATLDISSEAGRKNGQAMSAAAKAHDEMMAAGLAAGDSLSSMTKKSDQLRGEMLRLAESTGMTDAQAREYVNTLLGTPGEIKTAVKLERQDAMTGLRAVQDEIRKTPGAKSVTVETLNAAAIKALEAVGLKTRQLPDGRTEVFTKNGGAISNIAAVRRALDSLDGKTAHTYTTHHVTTVRREIAAANTSGRPQQGEGGYSKYATGGPVIPGFPGGGLLLGPGTSMSDSIPIWASTGEYIVKAASVARYGVAFMDALNEGRLPAGRAVRPGMPAPAPAATAGTGSGSQVTYIVNPRKSVIDINDLRLIQRQEEARQRVGRPG